MGFVHQAADHLARENGSRGWQREQSFLAAATAARENVAGHTLNQLQKLTAP